MAIPCPGPVGPHRQRQHHVPQQHRHVHRLLRDQRDPERDQRVRWRSSARVSRPGPRRRIPSPAPSPASASCPAPRPGPAGGSPPVACLGLGRRGRPGVALPRPPARTTPARPAAASPRRTATCSPYFSRTYWRIFLSLRHADPRTVQAVRPDRVDRLADRLRDPVPVHARSHRPSAQPISPTGIAGSPPLQRPQADPVQPGRRASAAPVPAGPPARRPWPRGGRSAWRAPDRTPAAAHPGPARNESPLRKPVSASRR